jgi:hypothetical protein
MKGAEMAMLNSPIALAWSIASNSANTTSEIVFWMKHSPNEDVRLWGLRLEAALLRERVEELEKGKK